MQWLFFLALLSLNSLAAKHRTVPPIDSMQHYLLQAYTGGIAGDSTIQPLRLLGERGMTPPYVQQNNSGIENQAETDLINAALDLVDAIPTSIATDFKVYDYTAYSLIGRMKDADKWNEWSFNTMDSLIRTKYNVQYYLLIGKEINPADGKVKFRVKLNVPTVGNGHKSSGERGSGDFWTNLTKTDLEGILKGAEKNSDLEMRKYGNFSTYSDKGTKLL